MSEYTPVTFIGGPWDMQRRMFNAEEVNAGTFRVLAPVDASKWTMDNMQRCQKEVADIRSQITNYYLYPVGTDKHGRYIMVAVAR